MLKSIFTDPVVASTLKSAVGVILATSVGSILPQNTYAQSKADILGIDHVGINVPDLQQAVNFFSDVLGFTPVTTLGPVPLDAAWKEANRMNKATGPVTIKMIHAGTGANIEVFSYQDNQGSKNQPGGDDIGASHIAFYTTDIKSAVTYLKSKNVQVLGEPFLMPSGDTQGESWVYFLTPWGSKMEFVSYPDGKGYEKNNPKTVLWSPKNSESSTVGKSENSPMSNEAIKSLVEQHLALWNEHNPAKRKQIMQAIYSPNLEMVDRHFVANGYEQVDSFIQDLQKKSPDFRFSHAKPIDIHHNVARLFWQVGSKSKPDAVTGMDLFVIENGKVVKMYVFVNEPK